MNSENNKKLVVIDWENIGIQVVYMFGTPEEILTKLETEDKFDQEHDSVTILDPDQIKTFN